MNAKISEKSNHVSSSDFSEQSGEKLYREQFRNLELKFSIQNSFRISLELTIISNTK